MLKSFILSIAIIALAFTPTFNASHNEENENSLNEKVNNRLLFKENAIKQLDMPETKVDIKSSGEKDNDSLLFEKLLNDSDIQNDIFSLNNDNSQEKVNAPPIQIANNLSQNDLLIWDQFLNRVNDIYTNYQKYTQSNCLQHEQIGLILDTLLDNFKSGGPREKQALKEYQYRLGEIIKRNIQKSKMSQEHTNLNSEIKKSSVTKLGGELGKKSTVAIYGKTNILHALVKIAANLEAAQVISLYGELQIMLGKNVISQIENAEKEIKKLAKEILDPSEALKEKVNNLLDKVMTNLNFNHFKALNSLEAQNRRLEEYKKKEKGMGEWRFKLEKELFDC